MTDMSAWQQILLKKKDKKCTQPIDKMITVPINGIQGANYLVSEKLSSEESILLARLLNKCKDEFAWTPSDMPGISRDVAEQHLNVDHDKWPIQQKRRAFSAEKAEVIEREVSKLLEADFIQEVQYPI